MTSIIILSYNTYTYTRRCIESIRRHTEPGTYELIVIDNGSQDESVAWLKQQTDINLVCNQENTGFPGGCNQGLLRARGGDILLLNSDTVVTPRWLKQLHKALHSAADVGAVGCLTNYCFNNQAIDTDGYTDLPGLLAFGERYNHTDASKWEEVPMLTGFCLLIKSEVCAKVGPLDESFNPGNYEDNDYCLRIMQAGYRLLLCRDTFIHHYGSRSFKAELRDATQQQEKSYNRLFTRNHWRFYYKWDVPVGYQNISADLLRRYLTAKHPAGGWHLDERKICFITCVDNPALYNETVQFLQNLNVPAGMTVESRVIEQADSMTAGYEQAMESSDARYKVYLHQDVCITDRDFLVKMVRQFRVQPDIGLLGACGSEQLIRIEEAEPSQLVGALGYVQQGRQVETVYQSNAYVCQRVASLAGCLLMTQYDVCWRSDILPGWSLYALSQCLEFQRNGFKVAVLPQSEPVCTHLGGERQDSHYAEEKQSFIAAYLGTH